MRGVFLLVFFCTSLITFGQDNNKLDQSFDCLDCSQQEVLESLQNDYGFRLSYATQTLSHLPSDKKFSFREKKVKQVLEDLLKDSKVEYKVVAENILFRRKITENDLSSVDKSLFIKGKVIQNMDQETSLSFATVMIKGSSIGTYTDKDGSFELEISEDHLDGVIEVSYMGFTAAEYQISELEEHYILAKLDVSDHLVGEIEIVNKEKPIKIVSQAIILKNRHIESTTSGLVGNDINRSIQLLPGVAAHDDDDAGIKIRGGGSDATLMILDGIPIYNACHYFGIFSSVNASFIDSVNVYKNAYPLVYGGGSSGLVEFWGNEQVANKKSLDLELDLLTARVVLEHPVSDHSSIKIAGRSTLQAISNERFNVEESNSTEDLVREEFGEDIGSKTSNPACVFHDVNASYLWKSDNNSSFQVNYFRSFDDYDNPYELMLLDSKNNEVKLNIDEDKEWSTNGFSTNWSQRLSRKTALKVRMHYSDYSNIENDVISIKKKFNGPQGPPPKNPDGVDLSSVKENNLLDVGGLVGFEFSSDKSTIDFGVIAESKEVDYSFTENTETILQGETELKSFESYASHRYKGDKFNSELGFRISYFDHLASLYYSPRLNLSYDLSQSFILKASWSYNPQVIRQLYYEYRGVPNQLWIAANDNDLPVLKANNLMLGYIYRNDLFTLDVEAYQKQLTGVIEYAVLNPDEAENNPQKAQDYRLFNGEGQIRGLDLILGTSYKQYDTYLAYSISQNLERQEEIDSNEYYPSENDRTHQLKWINSLSIASWSFGVNGIYSSGRPYTDLGNIGSDRNIRDTKSDDRFTRLPYYFRVDASIDYTTYLAGKKLLLHAGVYNLLNRQNVNYIQSVSTNLQSNNDPVNSVIGNESSLLNRTINLGIKLSL